MLCCLQFWFKGGMIVADQLSHGDLIAKIALNSKLTAQEVEEALEVLSVVVQSTLQGGGSVDILGIGTLSVSADRVVTFQVGQSLRDLVSDPGINVVIERRQGMLSGRLFEAGNETFSHKVNVCN